MTNGTVAECGTPRQPRWSTQPRAVIGPDGTRYASISAAGMAMGVYPSAIGTKVRLGRGGWRFATNADTPASGG